jgi:hypothetical protein
MPQDSKNFWELDNVNNVYMRHHVQPRKKMSVPDEDMVRSRQLSPFRFTNAIPCKDESS